MVYPPLSMTQMGSNAWPNVAERWQRRLVRLSPLHGPVHRKKGQVSGYDHPVSWIYVLSHFDGTERWVSFWFSFGARLSREPFFDIIPG